MRVWTFPPTYTLLIDSFLWLAIHLGFSYGCYCLPVSFFEKHERWFSLSSYERKGYFYERFLLIKRWKPFLPDGSALFKRGFRKRHLKEHSTSFFITFILESRRAELTHWFCVVPAPFFFIWNDIYSGLLIIIYALLANLPCIIVQRYNRIRLERVVARSTKK